jgi:hypothetical protein
MPAAKALGPSGQSVAINITKATTTQLVGPSGSTQIYVTAWDVFANAASTITLVYGTKATNPCDTGTTALTGVYNFAAQSGMSPTGGDPVADPLYVIPQGNALCAVTSGATVWLVGSLSYTQF